MPRTPKPRWHAGNQQWVSDVGETYVDPRGRQRRRTVAFPGIGRKEDRKAREALRGFLDQQAEKVRNANDPTLATVFELYLEWLEANREFSTYETVSGLLSKFTAWTPGQGGPMGRRAWSTLDYHQLEQCLAVLARTHKPSYCAVLHSAVNAAFNWASRRIPGRVPEILVESNPFKGVPRPAIPRSPERYAERDEVAAFLRWAWRRTPREDKRGRVSLTSRFDRLLCLLVRVAAHTGARPGELCITGKRAKETGFTWEQWNPDAAVNSLGHRVGLITHKKHKTSGKTGRSREIVVPPILVRAIERHRARDWAHPTWVFTHRRTAGCEGRGALTAVNGEPWVSNSLSLKIRKLRGMAVAEGQRLKAEGKPTRGLDLIRDEGDNRFVLYRLRHTRITDLIGSKGGLSNDQAAALTGTSGRMIETTYGHLTGTRLIDLDQVSRRRK